VDKSAHTAVDPNDLLILVDDNDEIIGYEEKGICHAAEGILHRAFSIFIFNSNGEFLLQKRSSVKPLWPGYWSNSVCSHPRKGETYDSAASRRLFEEVGLESDMDYFFKFRYHVSYENAGSENEMCALFAGVSAGAIKADPAEIAEWKFVTISELEKEMKDRPHIFTPWFKIEWQKFMELNLLPSVMDSQARSKGKRTV
jgi:isopentenyl-diphosphate Delta-isomerase